MEHVTPEHLFWLLGGVGGMMIALVIIGSWSDFRTFFAAVTQRYVVIAPHDSDDDPVHDSADSPVHERRTERPNAGSDPFPREIAERNPRSALELSVEELNAVRLMLLAREEQYAAGQRPTKSKTIYAGFGVKRGGSAAYERASAIYDALFGQPEPVSKYPDRTPDQIQTRRDLGLDDPADYPARRVARVVSSEERESYQT